MSTFRQKNIFYKAQLYFRHFQEKPFIIYGESGCLCAYKKLGSRRAFELCPRRGWCREFPAKNEEQLFFWADVPPNHVDSHAPLKNPTNILGLKNIKFTGLFSSLRIFLFVSRGRTNMTHELFGTFLRVKLQSLAKPSFYLFIPIVSTVYNSINRRPKSALLLPTT